MISYDDACKKKRFLFYEYAYQSVILEGGDGGFWVELCKDEPAEEIAKEFQQWLKDTHGVKWAYSPANEFIVWYRVSGGMEQVAFKNVKHPIDLDHEYPTLKTLWL